jgi:hypothetical protein
VIFFNFLERALADKAQLVLYPVVVGDVVRWIYDVFSVIDEWGAKTSQQPNFVTQDLRSDSPTSSKNFDLLANLLLFC